MNIFKILLILMLNAIPIKATINCTAISGNCKCIPGRRLEIQCPSFASTASEKFVVHISNELEVLLSCYEMHRFQMNLLANVTIGKTTKLNVRDCPLPVSFKEVVDRFSMQEVKVVQFETPPNGIVLLKEHFRGLEGLEKLKLNALRFALLDRNVFEFVPNVYFLQMERNHNLKLERNIFENMTRLECLYLANNYLSAIPDKLFHNLKSLKVLQLGNNDLKTISNHTFSSLSNLTILGLKDNQIDDISEDAFRNLINLSSLHLSRNKLTLLSGNIFKNTKLFEIWLDSNPELQLPDYLFENLPLLTRVSLKSCNLESLPLHLFENSSNLEVLDLSYNNFKRLPKFDLPNLKILILEKNSIDLIDASTFASLKSLQEVNLSRNQIRGVESGTFAKNNLTRIYLANNKYTGTVTHLLQGTTKVEIVDLSYNSITEIEDIFVSEKTRELKFLDLRHNCINRLQVNDLEGNHTFEMLLDANNITVVACNQCKTKRNVVISLANNPITCDCRNYEFLKHIQHEKFKKSQNSVNFRTEDLNCFKPPKLENQKFVSLVPSALTCRLNVQEPDKCSYIWRPNDKAIIINCSERNLTVFPEIDDDIFNSYEYNHTEIHLDRNNLTQGPPKNLTGYDNVTKLYLSENQIGQIDWLPPNLQVLWLNNNNLSYLGQDVLDILNQSSLVNFTLNHNPWRCDCDSANLTSFLSKHAHMTHVNNIYCSNRPEILLVNLNRIDICPQWLSWHFTIIGLLVCLSIATFVALYYGTRKNITLLLYAIFGDRCVDPDNLDKTYDAFISYSCLDDDFVIENIIEKLESGPNPFKLCVHYRDFRIGDLITENIVNAVTKSRRTIVVLSKNFLKSVWAKTEFRTAHTEAMIEERGRVIIVVYGDVDLEELDEELKVYVGMNTYLKWGETFFWDKLRYALLHSTMKKFWEDSIHIDNGNIAKCGKRSDVSVEVIELEQHPPICEQMDISATN